MVDIKKIDFKTSIHHGEKKDLDFKFLTENNINRIELSSYTAIYNTFWDTYKVWIIATLIISIVASIITIIVCIVNCIDVDDIFDSDSILFFGFFLALVGIPITTILHYIFANWVVSLIILCGIALSIITIVLALFIYDKFFY